MSVARNRVRWLATLGTALFVGGLAWISVLIYRIRDIPDEIEYEVRIPWTPRLMVFVGFWVLVTVAARIGIHHLRLRKLTGRGR